MAKQLQLRKGTAAEHSTFTGANGEVTVDTTNKTLRVHDGTTVGGTVLATVTGAVILNNTLTSTSTTQALTAAQGKVLKDSLNTAITSSFGVGQTWQNLTSSRASGVTYTNSTGKPIAVSIIWTVLSGSNYFVYVNGVSVINIQDYGSIGPYHSFFIVPTGASYTISTTNLIELWAELR